MPRTKTSAKTGGKSNSLRAAWAKRRESASQQIEKAALTYFSEHGIDGVTVDEIAEAAGISRRTFYRYFQTTDDIITAQARRALTHIAATFRTRPVEEPIYDSLLYALTKVGDSEFEVEINHLFTRVIKRAPEAHLRAMRTMHVDKEMELLIVERLRANGEDTADASMMASLLTAINLQVMAQARLESRDAGAEDFIRARAALAKIVGLIAPARRPRRG